MTRSQTEIDQVLIGWGTPPSAIDDQEQLFHEQAVGDDVPRTAGSEQFGNRHQIDGRKAPADPSWQCRVGGAVIGDKNTQVFVFRRKFRIHQGQGMSLLSSLQTRQASFICVVAGTVGTSPTATAVKRTFDLKTMRVEKTRPGDCV